MNTDKSVVLVAGLLLSGLVGYALWMMFSWPAGTPASLKQNTEEPALLQQETLSSPSPALDSPMPDKQDATMDQEFKKIEAEFNSSVILDADFSELEGE